MLPLLFLLSVRIKELLEGVAAENKKTGSEAQKGHLDKETGEAGEVKSGT